MIALAKKLNIYKLKLVFWQNDFAPNAALFALSENEKAWVVDTIVKLQDPTIFDWVVVPNYDLRHKEHFNSKLPEFIIQADGSVSIGESGYSIGTIANREVHNVYSKYVLDKKVEHLHHIFISCVEKLSLNVAVSTKKLTHSAGSVVKLKDTYYIFIHDNLPPILSAVIALHELGHIATDTLQTKEKLIAPENYIDAETQANQWVAQQIERYLPDIKKLSYEDYGTNDFYTKVTDMIHRNYPIF